MLKLSKTAIRELGKMYRAVLMGAFVTSVFVANGANATVDAIVDLGTFNPSTGYSYPSIKPVLESSDITTGITDGSISVNGTDVAVNGLGSAAYTESDAYDAAGAADAVATSLTDHTVDANFKSISTQLDDDPTSGLAIYGDAVLGDTTVNGNLSAGETTVNSLYSTESIETDGTLKAAGIDTTTDNKVKIGGTDYTTEITGDETVSGTLEVTGETTLTGALNSNGNVTLGDEATDEVTVNGTATFKEDVTIESDKSLQLGGTSGNTVDAIDNGSTAQTSGGATTMATVATVLKSAKNATYDGTKTNVKSETNTIKGAIQDLDTKIGTVATSTNGVANSNTVGENIDALNNKMGNVSDLGTYADSKGNLNKDGAKPATVVQGMENLDQSIGDRTSGSSNVAINTGMRTSLSEGLRAAGDQIGSLNYTSTRYVKQGMNLTEAVSALDRNIDRVDEKVKKMDKQVKSGFASMAAVAGLKPNARACNDTQIAIGGGYYRGTAGVALGAFHYVNDNLMLNIGGGYAGNQSATVSGGLTFGW